MKTSIVITSIAGPQNPVLQKYAKESAEHGVHFIVIGDTKSPENFELKNCDFYSIKMQAGISKKFSELLPVRHYGRKNLGYLAAIRSGTERLVETDDDNLPLQEFWNFRNLAGNYSTANQPGWINVYRYFSDENIWPRGLPLDSIRNNVPVLTMGKNKSFPVQQGLADGNPDVDAVYRLAHIDKDIKFGKAEVALSKGSWCPFNSQNTTWFPEAFPLLYLPSWCSFRMTDIWRSFVAQRIAWTCGWEILFHSSTVFQERNEHKLMNDFVDEIPGYLNNRLIAEHLENLRLKDGVENISDNMRMCYGEIISMGLVGKEEKELLDCWLNEFEAKR
jgi:hypothetical protein